MTKTGQKLFKSKVQHDIDIALSVNPAMDIGQLMRMLNLSHGALTNDDITYLLDWQPYQPRPKKAQNAPTSAVLTPEVESLCAY